MARRLSIGYLVPGHFLLSSAGPTRNVLSLARALAPLADVTVAFRRNLESTQGLPFDVLELEPEPHGASAPVPPGGCTGILDDAAVRGRGLRDLARYLRALRRFAREHDFDVVLEKSWIFSGLLARHYRERGTPSAVVENVVRQWSGAWATPSAFPGWLRHVVSQRIVRRGLRSADRVIAETQELEHGLRERFGLSESSLEVVGLGVDHDRFRPAAEEETRLAREELGLAPGTTLLLYSGVLDKTHDLTQVIQALGSSSRDDLALHIVGDGDARAELEALSSRSGARVTFHGRVEHARIPRFLWAADLSLAPYDLQAFPGGRVAYSTLKIPESMASAKPVASVPEGRPGELIRDGVSGFLLANTTESWRALFERLPERAVLAQMGREAVLDAAPIHWDVTAARYFEICRGLASEAVPA